MAYLVKCMHCGFKEPHPLTEDRYGKTDYCAKCGREKFKMSVKERKELKKKQTELKEGES